MGKVISLWGHAAGRDIKVETGPTNNIASIHGGTNIIGNHGPVTIHTSSDRPRSPAPAPVPPPEDRISDEQAFKLKCLHDDWVELSASVKTRTTPITPQAAWIAINRAGRCTTYKHMRQEHYEAASDYVLKQMAILRSGKVSRRRDPKWRNSRIGAIKARCINQLGDEFSYRPYIKKHFNALSLTELDDEQLESAYRYVLSLKPKIQPGSKL